MSQNEWQENMTSGEHELGTARAVKESEAFCILTFGTGDPEFGIQAIVAGTRYDKSHGLPITVARIEENRPILIRLQDSGAVKLGPYISDSREIVAIVAIKSDLLGK